MRVGRDRWPGVERAGLILLGTSSVTAGAVACVRYTRVQEAGARLFALAGMSGWILALLALGSVVGAVMYCWEGRARPAAGLSVLCVALALQAAWPTVVGLASGPDSGGDHISVLVQNLWYEHESPDRAARTILDQNATVMVLVEYSADFGRAFRSNGTQHRYPYSWQAEGTQGDGMAVFSKVPFTDARMFEMSAPAVKLVLEPPGAEIELLAVHVNAPRSVWDIPRWKSDFDALLAEAGRAGLDENRIMAGDFNATLGHLRFRELLDLGQFGDAQDDSGAGLGGTWPVGMIVPPVLRLDHILISRSLGVSGFRTLPDIGSDHLGILATVTFRTS